MKHLLSLCGLLLSLNAFCAPSGNEHFTLASYDENFLDQSIVSVIAQAKGTPLANGLEELLHLGTLAEKIAFIEGKSLAAYVPLFPAKQGDGERCHEVCRAFSRIVCETLPGGYVECRKEWEQACQTICS